LFVNTFQKVFDKSLGQGHRVLPDDGHDRFGRPASRVVRDPSGKGFLHFLGHSISKDFGVIAFLIVREVAETVAGRVVGSRDPFGRVVGAAALREGLDRVLVVFSEVDLLSGPHAFVLVDDQLAVADNPDPVGADLFLDHPLEGIDDAGPLGRVVCPEVMRKTKADAPAFLDDVARPVHDPVELPAKSGDAARVRRAAAAVETQVDFVIDGPSFVKGSRKRVLDPHFLFLRVLLLFHYRLRFVSFVGICQLGNKAFEPDEAKDDDAGRDVGLKGNFCGPEG